MGAERDHKHTLDRTGGSSRDPVPFTHGFEEPRSRFGRGLDRDTGTDTWKGLIRTVGRPPTFSTPPPKN